MPPPIPCHEPSANDDLGSTGRPWLCSRLGAADWVQQTGCSRLGVADLAQQTWRRRLGVTDLGSTAFVRLKMARAAELVCKLHHNCHPEFCRLSNGRPPSCVESISLGGSFFGRKPSTDQAPAALSMASRALAQNRQGRNIEPSEHSERGWMERRVRIWRLRAMTQRFRSRGAGGGPGRDRSQHSANRHWSMGHRNRRTCRAAVQARSCG
jgi:hypothetical protein